MASLWTGRRTVPLSPATHFGSWISGYVTVENIAEDRDTDAKIGPHFSRRDSFPRGTRRGSLRRPEWSAPLPPSSRFEKPVFEVRRLGVVNHERRVTQGERPCYPFSFPSGSSYPLFLLVFFLLTRLLLDLLCSFSSLRELTEAGLFNFSFCKGIGSRS